jgi:hypothetical protein
MKSGIEKLLSMAGQTKGTEGLGNKVFLHDNSSPCVNLKP